MQSTPKHLGFLILTYQRNKCLTQCIASVIASINSQSSDSHFFILIYDNDPSNNFSFTNFEAPKNVSFHYRKREKNIGPRANFSSALFEAYKEFKLDGVACVSDDDILLPDFARHFQCAIKDGYDAFICSSFIIDTSPNARNHSVRTVPTRSCRGPNQSKRQFIIDSRVFTGSGYSYDCLKRFFSSSPSMVDYLSSLWYPNAFISAAADKILFLKSPMFIHSINNQTHWGEFSAHDEMFLQRIDMFFKMESLGFIYQSESQKLVIDFIGHQSLKRIISLIRHKKKAYLFPALKVKLVRCLLLERIPHYAVAVSRRTQRLANSMRGI